VNTGAIRNKPLNPGVSYGRMFLKYAEDVKTNRFSMGGCFLNVNRSNFGRLLYPYYRPYFSNLDQTRA